MNTTKKRFKKPGMTMIGATVPVRVRAAIAAIARRHHRSVSGHVAALIEAEIQRANRAETGGAA